MSLYAYQVFETVIEQGSFAKAADNLGLTPSAISHIIANLEDEYGVKLLYRSRSGVRLTSAGETLLPYIRQVRQGDVRLHQELDRMRGLDSGIVRLGAFSSVTNNWVPEMLGQFRAEYPGISIQLYQGGYDDMIAWMDTLGLDVAFMSETVLSEFTISEDIRFIPLYEDPLVCVTPRDYLLQYKDSVRLTDIKSENFIMALTGYDQDARHLLKRHKLNVPANYHIADDHSILALVEAGLGITIMSEMIVKNSGRNVRIIPLNPAEHRTIGLIVREGSMHMPAVERLIETIRAYVEDKA